MITIIIIALLALFVIMTYNSLIRSRNEVTNSFATIDVMLKKRYDLIPNLVASVQKYAEHEKGVFEKVVELRQKNYSSLSDEEKITLDKEFNKASRSFFAVAENYPDLKASTNFLQLQASLNETEEQLSAARRTYNAAVTDYNNKIQVFPNNIFAGALGFTKKEVLVIPEVERERPNVKELFNS
ncbi:MAG: LemA family protein [Bacteroidales bacterium]|nr:LemA family protein [Bacteroidales bacterium]